jgi:hypothetical protein
MRRLLAGPAILGGIAAMFMFSAVATAETTISPEFAPTGTHFQQGSATCGLSNSGNIVCSSYQLAGVGNSNATASLTADFTATVKCRNHGQQIVEVKTQSTGATASTGALQPKNGKLTVPSLSTQGTAPSGEDFEAQATCPNPNWTKEVQNSTIAVSSFVYTLHFDGFSGDYITITG